MAKKNQLGSALGIILGSAVISTIAMIMAAVILEEALYYVAAALFAISGAVGVIVIRKLSKKMGSW